MHCSQGYKASNTKGRDLEKWVRASLNFNLKSLGHILIITITTFTVYRTVISIEHLGKVRAVFFGGGGGGVCVVLPFRERNYFIT